jgi:uncharacterized membrane protein YfcA
MRLIKSVSKMLEFLIAFIILFVGLLDGVIDGMVGASGGMFNVPVLNLIGLPIKSAIGTSLLVDVVGDSVVAYTYHEYKNVDLAIGLPLMIGAILGGQIGSAVGSALPSFGLESLYSVFLIISGAFFLKTKGRIKNLSTYNKIKIKSLKINGLFSIIIGLCVGSFMVIIGGGGGMVILLALILLFGFPIHKAVGTSVIVEIGSSLSGFLGYAIRGHVNIQYSVFLMIGIVIGGRLTARYVNKISKEKFSKIVGLMKINLGILLIPLRFL